MNEDTAARVRGNMPFRQHLVELRRRILRSTLAIAVGFFIAWSFHVELYAVLIAPIRDVMADNGLFSIKALQITESIAVYMKLALFAGITLSSPVIFYQVWAFITPGLEDKEMSVVIPVVLSSVIFFLLGIVFCYLVVLPFMTDFLIKLTLEGPGLTLEPTLQSTFSYSLWLLVAFGLIFELPVFMYLLSALELVTAKGLLAFYRYWVVISFVLGALLTPTPDPLNQAMMSGPLVLLYGVGIGISWLVERDRRASGTLSWRALSVLALLLMACVLGGASHLLGKSQRHPLQDISNNVRQLVGVHTQTLDAMRQRATGPNAVHALGMTALLPHLRIAEPTDSTLWMARFDDGAALILKVSTADHVPAQVAKQLHVSLSPYAGGSSAVFALEGEKKRWRLAAPDDNTIWLGHDSALAHLAATRRGELEAIADDQLLTDAVTQLRASAPVWSFTTTASGFGKWLPGGALSDMVKQAQGVVSKKGDTITFRLSCQGSDAAKAVRNRIDSWSADIRAASSGDKGPVEDTLVNRIEKVALLLSRLGNATALNAPLESRNRRSLQEIGEEARLLATEIAERKAKQDTRPEITPIASLVQTPAISTVRSHGSEVIWKVETSSDRVFEALFLPSRHGVSRQTVQGLTETKKEDAKPVPAK